MVGGGWKVVIREGEVTWCSGTRVHLKAVPKVNVQDLPAQPVQHQVGWVSLRNRRETGGGQESSTDEQIPKSVRL